ncbi:MAG: GrpB family protein [Holosporales bacterium]|jgi:GrpB-like predicted nucleotidyltransferase (UPF0157 family)|nr:GrpB family protein [Holosporales bacterium]
MGKRIEIVQYNSEWPAMFESERTVIKAALGSNLIAIHHIGSTAVPGLPAKPKIDIIAIARDRKRALPDLEGAGYQHKGEWNVPLKCGFTKRSDTDANLHLFFDENHPEIELNLLFRDYLRSNPDVRDEYAAIKKQILQDEISQQKIGKLSFPIYTIRKSIFINKIVKDIGFDRLRILKCLTDNEQNAIKMLRKDHFDRFGVLDPLNGNLDDVNHEHFMLYRGVEIVGYADIHILSKNEAEVHIFEAQNHYHYFNSVIKEWMKVHGYIDALK